MSFLRNAWYVAAWDEEIKQGEMLHRRLLNEPILMFRDADGRACALRDRCPHRFAPLHLGNFDGQAVQCRYHGLKFDARGACVHNPHGTLPKSARVQTYPIAELHSMIWIWMGDADKADSGLIPDFSFQDSAQSFVGKDYLHVRSNYLLEIDNILDLSHIQFLHPTTLGSGGVAEGRYEAAQEGDTVWSKRMTNAEVMTDGLCDAMGIPRGAPADRWMNVRWSAPANMALFAGAVLAGRPPSEGHSTPTGHCFTPETDSTTHYWFSISFPKTLGEAGEQMAKEQIKYLRMPFELEDLPLLEEQQQSMANEEFWSLKPILLATDAGGVRARRTLGKLIAEELAAQALAADQ